MKALYFFRVLFLGFEAVVLLLGVSAWCNFLKEINFYAGALSLNEDFLKYLMTIPIVLAVWVFNEIRTLLLEDKDTMKILLRWPDYWKLKIHAWVSLFYAVLFSVISILPWVVKSGISTGGGMILFLVSLLGQLSLSVSVYLARVSLKETIVGA